MAFLGNGYCSSGSEGEDEDEGMEGYRKGGYHAARPGDRFAGGRFVAQRKLGWGNFSTVWLAYDTLLNVRLSCRPRFLSCFPFLVLFFPLSLCLFFTRCSVGLVRLLLDIGNFG
jgi:hypothetical protein